VAGKALNCTLLKGFLHLWKGRVRINHIASLLQENGVIKAFDLNLPADILGSLAPFKLDDAPVSILVDHIFGNTIPCVFHIKLDNNGTVSVIVAQIGLYSPVKLRSRPDLSPFCLSLADD